MNNSKSVSAKVISDARNEEILSLYRMLHGKVLVALAEIESKPLFPENFDKCGAEDYKLLHQQSRILVNAHKASVWEKRVSGIRANLKGALAPFLSKREKSYKAFMAMDQDERDGQAFNFTVVVPMSDISASWPQGTSDGDIYKDLLDMGYKPTKQGDKTYIKVTFEPSKEVAEVGESAPKSGEVMAAAAE